ncbi:hypothetical protein Tco_1008803 [Tanacetum coccineum]
MPVMMSYHHDKWPIWKVLTLSDVDIKHPFLTLLGKSIEDHILFAVFFMKLKWRGSYYYLIGKCGQIITGKTLEVGQEIRARWDNGY